MSGDNVMENPDGENLNITQPYSTIESETVESPEGPEVEDIRDGLRNDEDVQRDILSTREFVQVELLNIETVYPDVFPKLVLRSVDDPNLEFAFSVGSFEAVSIANAWRNIYPPRPLTHDLFAEVLAEFGAAVEEVRIYPKEMGNYVGEIVMSSPRGPKRFDCRPSDAIALALRQKLMVPIMCAPQLFED